MKHAHTLLCRRPFNHLFLLLCLCLISLAVTPGTAETASGKKGKAPAKASKKAASAPAALQTGPADVVGRWGPLETLDTVPVHISLLPDGRLLYWGRDKDPTDKWDIGGSCQTYTWHPTTKARVALASKPPANLFCSGHSFLPDGRLLVAGGHVRDEADLDREGIGEDDINVFDYRTNEWTRVGFMPHGRWYPSTVTLANGETVIVSGTKRDPDGRIGLNLAPDLFTSAGTIRPFTAERTIPIYPFLHLAPNGKVFIVEHGADVSKYFDPTANGGNGLFTDVAFPVVSHISGSTVIYDSVAGKVLVISGHRRVTGVIQNEAEVINLSDPSPSWQSAFTLAFGRKFHTATVMPDGKVLVAGGTQCKGANAVVCMPDGSPCTDTSVAGCQNRAATHPELWDPQTGTLTTMAANPSGIPRAYHSVAVLLPDARVLVGGGGLPAAGGEVAPPAIPGATPETCKDNDAPLSVNCRTHGHRDVEIFSPPYLFTSSGAEAPRPSINTAPASITYGQNFDVGTTGASQNGSVVLIRLPSVTHGFNFDQRRVVLNFTATSSTNLNVTAPPDGRVCPPGPYMLFVLNASGVPSVAKTVFVGPNVQPPPSAPPGLDAVAAAPNVALTWGASTGDVSHYVVERATTRTGPFSTVGANVTDTSFDDTTAASGVTYIYRVRAVAPSGAASDFSNTDIATTVLFTDHPLFPGLLVKAEHLDQLRLAVNAVRAAAGLPAVNWTDPSLSAAVFIRAVHMQELRTSLDPALSLLRLPVNPYTDPTLTPDSTPTRAVHWQEIRDRVK